MPAARKKTTDAYSMNRIRLVRGGRDYFTLLAKLIDEAQSELHVQAYIYADDTTGQDVAQHLMRAARRGVRVCLLVDGYASQHLNATFIGQLEAAGVHFGRFEPLFKSRKFYFGRRLHHKVMVADGRYALVAGLNIADRYNDLPDYPAWLDFGLYVEGPVAADLERICVRLWNGASRTRIAIPARPSMLLPEAGLSAVRVRRNDWVKNKDQVWKSYRSLFNEATDSMLIISSYFLPGLKYRRALAAAAKRGVHIRIIVAGKSDVPIAKYAERYLYRWILSNNITLYEYQAAVLHAKLAMSDGAFMTIGSFNSNNISARAGVELNLDVRDAVFVQKVQDEIEALIRRDCRRIDQADVLEKTGWFRRLLYRLAYELIKMIVFLSTFYFRKAS